MNRGAQAKIFIFIFLILILSFTIFVYSKDPEQPEITREYTPSTTSYIRDDGKTDLVLWGGIRNVYEDGEYKPREKAKSFKEDSNINCVVKSDGVNLATCLDYNETSRTIEFSSKTEGFVPLRKYNLKYNRTSMENYRVYDEEFETVLDLSLTASKENLVLKANPGEIIEFGEFSTEIILDETNVGNLYDGYVMGKSGDEDKENGAYVHLEIMGLSTRFQRVYIKYNISAIPSGATIETANLSFYAEYPKNYRVEAYHVYDKGWVSDTNQDDVYYPRLTHNSQPCGTAFDDSGGCNVSDYEDAFSLSLTAEWRGWNVVNALRRDYADGDTNFSIVLKHQYETHGDTYAIYLCSKEHGTTEFRPFLNITYTPEIVNLPPVINLQAPENNTELTPGSVEFIYNVSDPDDPPDNIDNCSLWLNNGTGFVEKAFNDTITPSINQSFPPQTLGIGNYTWKVSCYDNFPNEGESEIRKIIIFGVNHAPTIDVPSISPDPAYTDSTLQCSTTAYDEDLDSLTIEFKWYKDSGLNYTENKATTNGTLKTSTLTPGIQNKNEIWNCTVRAFDGQNYSSFKSDTITISNTVPAHYDPTLSSTTPYNASNEDLTCLNQSTQDKDNDKVTNIYSWYLDSNPLAKLNLPFEINADDYSGSNNDGTISGDPQYITGKYGNALEFDGVNDKVTAGDLGISANGPATIEGWFNFKQFAQGSSHKGLHSNLYQHTTGNHLYIPGTNDYFLVASILQLNTWHHIVLTYSGDSSTAKLYIDGEDYDVIVQGSGETVPALDNFLVGDRGYDTFFNGSIDEVRVYDRALSSNELSEHFNLNYDKIKSTETSVDEVWKCKVVPNDGEIDGLIKESNTITIQPNVYDITFNITEGEYGNDLTGVMIACDNGWSVDSTDVNPYGPVKFYEGSYSCEFSDDPYDYYYNKTETLTADSDKQIDIILSKQKDMTIEEHNWLEAIYLCLYKGNCYALDLLEEINETTQNLWDQFKPTDKSVVIQEDILSNTLSSTQNIIINYTIKAPPKAGYSDGDYAPMKIAFWFLDSNDNCLDQDKVTTDTNRAEKIYCIPLIAETLAVVNQEVNFLVELRPNLPEGTYEIVRDIEIDPNQVWIKYGQEVIDTINVLEDNENTLINLIKSIIQSQDSSSSESNNDKKSSKSKTKEVITERIIEREIIKPTIIKSNIPTEETPKNIYTTKHIINNINIPLLIFTLLLTIVIILGILLVVIKKHRI